jgi:MFS family permease
LRGATRRPWVVLTGCFLLATGFNAYLLAPASLIPLLTAEFGIDKTAAGFSISVVFLAWALLQIPGGLLMDRYDNRRLIWAGVVVFAVAAVAGFFAPTYPTFLLTRFIGGIAAVSLWAASANVVGRVFPESSRALGTSLFITSAPAGGAIAQFGGPLVAAEFGWRAVLVVYPLVTLLGLPLFSFALREPIRNETRLDLSTFATTLRDPPILLVSLSSFCAYSLFVFFNSWMPTYATEELSIDLAAAGAMTALVPLVGFAARPGGGWLSDRIGGRRRPVIVAAFALALPVFAVISTVSSATGFGALLVVAGLASQLGTGVFYVYVNELSSAETSGTSLSVLTTLSMTGALVAPVLAGWLIESLSWTAAFGFGALLAVGGIAAIAVAPPAA